MTKIPTWQERAKYFATTELAKQEEIADLRAALTKARRMARKPDCKWTHDANEYMDKWDSACGEAWSSSQEK